MKTHKEINGIQESMFLGKYTVYQSYGMIWEFFGGRFQAGNSMRFSDWESSQKGDVTTCSRDLSSNPIDFAYTQYHPPGDSI